MKNYGSEIKVRLSDARRRDIEALACGLLPGEFIHSIGDAHLYVNHLDQASLLLSRAGVVPSGNCPRVDIRLPGRGDPFESILGLMIGDITLSGYKPMDAIKADVAV